MSAATRKQMRNRLGVGAGVSTRQTVAVLQHVVECSIAGICYERGLFPDHFFDHHEIETNHCGSGADGGHSRKHTNKSNGMTVAKFASSLDNDSNCRDSYYTTATADGKGDSVSAHDGHKSYEGHRCEEGENVESRGSRSPNCYTASDAICGESETANKLTLSHRNTNKSMASASDCCDEMKKVTLLEAEAKILVYWIRSGVFDLVKALVEKQMTRAQRDGSSGVEDEQLGRVSFGIHKNKGSDACLVEMYKFDISHSAPENIAVELELKQIQNQYSRIFKNLQSVSEFTRDVVAVEALSTPDFGRYFTMKIEFDRDKVETLPLALNPIGSYNRNYCNYATRTNSDGNSYLPTMASTFDSGLGSQEQGCKYSETINHRNIPMVATSLGKIAETKCTGINMKVTAYHINDSSLDLQSHEKESYKSKIAHENTGADNTAVDGRGDGSVLCSKGGQERINVLQGLDLNAYHKRSVGFERKAFIQHKAQTSPKMSCFESEQSHASREYEKNLIENLSRAFAMPIMPSSSTVVHIKCPRLYLPCTILDHRVMDGEWQYKVLFEEDVLMENKMKKQWLWARRVVEYSKMVKWVKREVLSYWKEYKMIPTCNNADASYSYTVAKVVDKIPMSVSFVEHVMGTMKFPLRNTFVSIKGNVDEESIAFRSTRKKRRYYFMKEAVHSVIS